MHGASARRRLLALSAALKSNEEPRTTMGRVSRSQRLRLGQALRNDILAAGPGGAPAIARQAVPDVGLVVVPDAEVGLFREDPREWAGADLQAKRRRWALESLREAKMPSSSAGGQLRASVT